MNGFQLTGSGCVKLEWIDMNDHMNTTWHAMLFDDATFQLADKIGINQERMKQGTPMIVAGRLTMSFRKELLKWDRYEVWSGFVAVAAEGVTVTHRLKANNVICSSCDMRCQFLDPKTRKRTILSEDLVRRAQSYLILGITDPFM